MDELYALIVFPLLFMIGYAVYCLNEEIGAILDEMQYCRNIFNLKFIFRFLYAYKNSILCPYVFIIEKMEIYTTRLFQGIMYVILAFLTPWYIIGYLIATLAVIGLILLIFLLYICLIKKQNERG